MHNGTLAIDQDGKWKGMVNGDLIVRPGRRVVVAGMVNGEVVVEQGAEARITGIVKGRVIENGGRATITGSVDD